LREREREWEWKRVVIEDSEGAKQCGRAEPVIFDCFIATLFTREQALTIAFFDHANIPFRILTEARLAYICSLLLLLFIRSNTAFIAVLLLMHI